MIKSIKKWIWEYEFPIICIGSTILFVSIGVFLELNPPHEDSVTILRMLCAGE